MSCAVFWRSLSGRLVVGGYDLSLYSYPYRVAVAEAIRHGRLPFWNPHVYLGVPLLANIPSAVFYPFNLLFVVWTRPQVLTVLMVLHVWLAGAFFYAFARRALEAAPAAALIGAIAFGLGGYSIRHSEQLNIGNAIPWMPVVVLGLDQAYRRRSLRWAAVLAIGLTLQLFAGHPQIVYYTALVALAWLAGLMLPELRRDPMRALRGASTTALGVVTGLLVAAVQLLPTLQLSRQSLRSGGLGAAVAGAGPLPAAALLPQVLGDYAHAASSEWAAGVGVVTLSLAFGGVLLRWREPLTWTVVAVSLLAVLLALGHPTPQYDLGYQLLPGLALFRAPSRILLIIAFTVPTLATLGAAALQGRRALLPVAVLSLVTSLGALAWLWQGLGQRGATAGWYLVPPVGAQLLAWGALTLAAAMVLTVGRRSGWPAVAMLCALSCADLLLAAQPSNVTHPVDPVLYTRQWSTTRLLPSAQSPYRSLSLARTVDVTPPVAVADPGQRDLLARAVIEHPDLTTRDGLASVDGYEGGILPLGPYVEFRRLLIPPGFQNQIDRPFTYVSSEPVNRPLLQLLGVRYLLISSPEGVAGAQSLGYEPVDASQGLIVFRDDNALPRAHLIGNVVAVADDSQARALMATPGFDPRVRAAVARISCPAAGSDHADAQLTRNDPETVQALTRSSRTALLVISSADFPGWTAEVDGRPAPLGRVDGLLQGVCVPPGEHQVVLRFRPSRWPLAVGLSAVGSLLLVALVLVPALRRRGVLEVLQGDRTSQRSRG